MAEKEYIYDSFETYLGNKSHISSSDCKNFLNYPAYYFFRKYEEKPKEEEARHFLIGSALHALVLEPESFNNRYCFLLRAIDRRTKDGKKEWIEFTERNKGKEVLTLEEWQSIERMAGAALKNKTFVALIKDSVREVSIYTTDPASGLKIKLRPDIWVNGKSIIVDCKTTTDASKDKFRWSVKDFNYDLSAAFYLNFSGRNYYLFAALQKTEPSPFALYQLSENIIERGRTKYRMALDCLAFCYKHNVWPTLSEWEIMKRCYIEDNLEGYFDALERSDLIGLIE